ncbi:MAG: tyrosine-type recombinase/integrase [Sphingomonadales bacterium]|nr:tyrosine-type recombinase/integrase [Sphingomonadales bacterium]
MTKPGRYADGGGLYLSISDGARARWVLLYMVDGKRREMGLGSARDVSLADARRRRDFHRAKLAEGIDPLAERQETLAAEEARRAAEAKKLTFKQAAADYIDAKEGGWKNLKHRQQWRNTLATYCGGLDDLHCHVVSVADVEAVLQPIWLEKPETARRVRMRIENVLASAHVKCRTQPEWRGWTNPAILKGNLDHLLPKKAKTERSHASMPYTGIPVFVAALREREALSARALEILILTACRTSEVTGMRWKEIDLEKATWVIPAERMKNGLLHRVPLTERALSILTDLKGKTGKGEFVFAARRGNLSSAAMHMLLQKRMNRPDVTVHGFRASFRTWAAERTSVPRAVAERALAHVVEGDVERSYQRSDHFEQRRALMGLWEAFIDQVRGEKVVAFSKAAS